MVNTVKGEPRPISKRFASSFAFNQQIVALDGGQLIEGQLVTIDDGVNAVTIEFDTGYTMRSPLTGLPGIIDGETFTISNIVTGTHHQLRPGSAAYIPLPLAARLHLAARRRHTWIGRISAWDRAHVLPTQIASYVN